MAEQGTLRPGDVVTHPDWASGTVARVHYTRPQQVRERRGDTGRALKPQPEDFENVTLLDRQIPIQGSCEQDAHWMESGLVRVLTAKDMRQYMDEVYRCLKAVHNTEPGVMARSWIDPMLVACAAYGLQEAHATHTIIMMLGGIADAQHVCKVKTWGIIFEK